MSLQGYKILLDLIASANPKPRLLELPYTFKSRRHGESKLDTLVAWEYLTLLLDKLVGRWVPIRFIMFAGVGGLGVFVHMAVLSALYVTGMQSFFFGQSEATVAAMTFNFFMNNLLTCEMRTILAHIIDARRHDMRSSLTAHALLMILNCV